MHKKRYTCSGIATTHHVVPNVNPNSDRLNLHWPGGQRQRQSRQEQRQERTSWLDIRGGGVESMIIKIMRVTAAAQIARKIDVFASIIDRQSICESGVDFLELTYSIVSCKLGDYSLIMVM